MKASELKAVMDWAYKQGQRTESLEQDAREAQAQTHRAFSAGVKHENARITELQQGYKLVPIDPVEEANA